MIALLLFFLFHMLFGQLATIRAMILTRAQVEADKAQLLAELEGFKLCKDCGRRPGDIPKGRTKRFHIYDPCEELGRRALDSELVWFCWSCYRTRVRTGHLPGNLPRTLVWNAKRQGEWAKKQETLACERNRAARDLEPVER